jgi:hypothetical protein
MSPPPMQAIAQLGWLHGHVFIMAAIAAWFAKGEKASTIANESRS